MPPRNIRRLALPVKRELSSTRSANAVARRCGLGQSALHRLRALALTMGLAVLFLTTTFAEVKVGDKFPDLAKFKLEGNLPADLKGKIVLVDFWASWCGPCKDSFPAMNDLQKKYGEQGLVIIAVNEDEKKSDMEDFLKENKVTFTVVRDAAPDGKKLVDKVEIPTMPGAFLLDGEGKVRFAHTGFHGADTKKKYEQEIQSLLKK
jgi:cytochrome c biogenesis protein CcmG, thiol:disulfide interchange protein DsbE